MNNIKHIKHIQECTHNKKNKGPKMLPGGTPQLCDCFTYMILVFYVHVQVFYVHDIRRPQCSKGQHCGRGMKRSRVGFTVGLFGKRSILNLFWSGCSGQCPGVNFVAVVVPSLKAGIWYGGAVREAREGSLGLFKALNVRTTAVIVAISIKFECGIKFQI